MIEKIQLQTGAITLNFLYQGKEIAYNMDKDGVGLLVMGKPVRGYYYGDWEEPLEFLSFLLGVPEQTKVRDLLGADIYFGLVQILRDNSPCPN